MTNEELFQSLSLVLNQTLEKHLAPIHAEIADLKDRMTSIENEMTSIKSRMTSIENEMASMKGEMTSMKGEMASMQDDITSIKGEMTSMKDEMASMKDEMASMKGEMASMKDEMVTKSDLEHSENLILNELSRTHNIMLERTDSLRNDLNTVKQSVAAIKSNNELATLLTDKIVNHEKRLTKVEKEVAQIA